MILILSYKEIQLGFRTGFRDKGFPLSFFQDHRHLAFGIIEVTEIHAFGRAGSHTGRFKSFPDPGDAESTFIDITFRMGIPGIIWTGGDACSTADAFVWSDQYDPAVFIMAGAGRTAPYAGGIVAMVAAL
jgi:hypothetical protein